jgi:hypothetical protein
MPVLFPVHPRTRKMMEAAGATDRPGLTLSEPLGYLEFLSLVADAGGVLTDSGGIQEETTYLGVPCFTLRDNTERPVTVRAGTNVLLGLDPAAIATIPERLAAGRGERPDPPPLWDGRAAERLAEVVAGLEPRPLAGSGGVVGGVVVVRLALGSGFRRLFAGSEKHAHVAAFLERRRLDHREAVEILEEALEQVAATLGVSLLTTAEHDRDLDLVVVLEEALDMALLGFVVVLGDLRPQLDLADVDLLLVLAGLLLLLLLLVLVLRVVEQARDRRLRARRDLDQVEIGVGGALQRVVDVDDAELLAVGADQANLRDADSLIRPRLVALWEAPIEPAGDRHYREKPTGFKGLLGPRTSLRSVHAVPRRARLNPWRSRRRRGW